MPTVSIPIKKLLVHSCAHNFDGLLWFNPPQFKRHRPISMEFLLIENTVFIHKKIQNQAVNVLNQVRLD